MDEELKAKHRFELIKIAREILNEEYLNKRAEDHNRWIAANDIAKLHNRMRVPYPPFVQFPTEAIILQKARALYAFVYDESAEQAVKSFPKPEVLVVHVPAPIPAPVVIVEEPIIEEPSIVEIIEEVIEEVIEEIVEVPAHVPPLMSDDSKHESHGFLPGWIRRPR